MPQPSKTHSVWVIGSLILLLAAVPALALQRQARPVTEGPQRVGPAFR